jgi:hypothetical protein
MMWKKLLPTLAMATACALPLVTAADSATNAPAFGDYQAKGFLTEYSKLRPSTKEKGAYSYRDPAADLGNYNKLLVDRIKIWFKEDSDYKGIDPDELKMLTDYFYAAIEKAMGDAYPMVADAGPEVLRLRIALTDVVPNKPKAAWVSLVVPFAWVADAGSGVAKGKAGSTASTGEATIEMEALDSTTGQQLAAYIETEVGKKYQWTKGIDEGTSSYIDAYSKWDYTKKAIDQWAQLIRQRLDEAHARPVDKPD